MAISYKQAKLAFKLHRKSLANDKIRSKDAEKGLSAESEQKCDAAGESVHDESPPMETLRNAAGSAARLEVSRSGE